MQNVRLQELEQLLSQTSIQPKVNNTPIKVNVPSEEVSGVKEENRVLNEAVEVLQIQVDEYKREIRSMKEPTKHRANGSTPRKKSMTSRKSVSFGDDISLSKLGINNDLYTTQQQ